MLYITLSCCPSLQTIQEPQYNDAGDLGRCPRFSSISCSLRGHRDASSFLSTGRTSSKLELSGCAGDLSDPPVQVGFRKTCCIPSTMLVLLQPRPSKGDHGMRGFLPSAEQQYLGEMGNRSCPTVTNPLEPWHGRT